MDTKYVLVEHISNINTIIKQPLQLTQRIKFTAFNVSKSYIVFGASSGGLYVFNRHPNQFIKLIPSKEGSIVQVCISPDEKHISLASSKGVVMVIPHFLETYIQYHGYYEHRENLVTALKWNGDELYCGDNKGKITIITLPSLLAKAMFQPTCATLMQLDSAIIQFDIYSKFLLVSTLTRTYICDTDKEQYRQIGKKLRNGNFGACFFTNGIDTNTALNETLTKRGIFKKSKDDEQFFAQINDNVQIFCTRPGTRVWEAKLNASVTRTHQFRNLLKHPINILKLGDNVEFGFNTNNPNSDFNLDDINNFSTVFMLKNKFIITFNQGAFYIFDPITGTIICWSNYFKNIKDIKVVDNFIYIWNDKLEMNVVALYMLEEIILKTLFRKQYYLCAQLCIEYTAEIVDLVVLANNIHLVSILKDKIIDQNILQGLSPIFKAIQNYSDQKIVAQRLKTGIVTVNPLFHNDQMEKEQLPESLQILKGLGANVTEKLSESTKNLKEKFQILETTVKNLTSDDNAILNGGTDNINNHLDSNSNNSLKLKDNTKSNGLPANCSNPIKIFQQQYQLSKINHNLESPKFYQLLDKHNLNSVVRLFQNFFNHTKETECEEDVKIWCCNHYLKYLLTKDVSEIESSDTDDTTIQYALESFLKLNSSENTCVCLYPTPSAKEKLPQHYEIGCVLTKKFWNITHQLYDEMTKHVPFMWKYILGELRHNENINNILPLLMQFGDTDLIQKISHKFTYDQWDDALKLLIKLKTFKCVHCDNVFDKNCNVMSWTDFGTILLKSVGAQSAVHLLMFYSNIIPSSELSTDFYQTCIFTTVLGNNCNGISDKAVNFTKLMLNNDHTKLEFDDIIKKFLQRSYIKKPFRAIKKNGLLYTAKTDFNCTFCDLPLETSLFTDYIKLSCKHFYHPVCYKYNENICRKCNECT